MNQQPRFTSRFGSVIVSPYPLADALADVPTGIVPDQDHDRFSFLSGDVQQSNDEEPHVFTVGLPRTEIQIDLLAILPSGSEAGEGLLRFPPFRLTLNQLQGFAGQRPGMSRRLAKPREPALVFIKQQPIRALTRLRFQPVSPLFLPS